MSDGAASERRALWLAGAADAVVAAYGAFTVVCTSTTVTGTSARVGLGLGSLALLLLAACAWLPSIRTRWLPAWRADVLAEDTLGPLSTSARVRAGCVLAAALAAVLWQATRSPVLAWGSALLLSGALCAIGVAAWRHAAGAPAPGPSPPISAWQLRAVIALALGCAVLTLLCVRPRTDDPFYINVSVGLADHPERPLLAVSTMHGPATDTLPEQAMFVPYRVHSFEALGGYLSYLTGIEAVAIVHFGLATFFAAFAVFALARLFRITAPRHWLLALFVTLVYLWVEGSAGRGFANQAFVRLFHGKSVMLTALVPLILAYGIRFGARPSWSRFALLALAQISAMGLTSTSIWLAPILAMLAVSGAVPEPRRLPRAALLCALSSGYVLLLGLWVRFQLKPDMRLSMAKQSVLKPGRSFEELAFDRLGLAIAEVLGGDRASLVVLFAVVLACVVAERAAVSRVLAGLALLLAAVLTNPWLIDFVSSSLTGALTYERAFWVLPVPAAFGLGAAGLCALLTPRFGQRRASAIAGVGALALIASGTERLAVSEANGASLHFPPVLKTSERLREVAAEVCQLAPAGTTVLASEPVSRQLVIRHHCSPPVIAGMRWIQASLEEERHRVRLQRYVSEKQPQLGDTEIGRLVDGITRYRISVVVMTPDAMANRPVKAALRDAGFEKASVVGQHHVYVRRTESARRGGARR